MSPKSRPFKYVCLGSHGKRIPYLVQCCTPHNSNMIKCACTPHVHTCTREKFVQTR